MLGTREWLTGLKLKGRQGKPWVHIGSHFDCTMGDNRESQLVYILPVAIHINWYTTTISQIKGLILHPTNNERGQYRRVGHFDMYQDTWDQLEAEPKGSECLVKDSDYQTIRVNAGGQRHHRDSIVAYISQTTLIPRAVEHQVRRTRSKVSGL